MVSRYHSAQGRHRVGAITWARWVRSRGPGGCVVVCTVYNDGSICLDILKSQWSPIYDISAILTSIQARAATNALCATSRVCARSGWWAACRPNGGVARPIPRTVVMARHVRCVRTVTRRLTSRPSSLALLSVHSRCFATPTQSRRPTRKQHVCIRCASIARHALAAPSPPPFLPPSLSPSLPPSLLLAYPPIAWR